MRTRKHQVSIYLDEKEYTTLTQLEKKTGLSKSQLIRNLLLKVRIKEQPTEDIATVRRALSAIGNNVNQIARVVNTKQNVSNEQFTVIRKMLTNLREFHISYTIADPEPAKKCIAGQSGGRRSHQGGSVGSSLRD